MPTRSDLDAAYRATTYRVFLPGGCCDLRVGALSETLRCWLETAGASQFAILTAQNPGSQPLDEEENRLRQAQLECDLLEAGYEPFVGENVADLGDWPGEESCFVAGITLDEALALAAKYGQNALICGIADGLPQLVWVTDAPA
jgi:Protein of unknown function (DUF3293)